MVSPKLRAKILKDAETARRLEQDAREKVLANAVASRMAQQDEKTKAFKQSSKDAAGFLSDIFLPQDLSEAALMAALAPGRWLKKGAGPLVKMANETSSMRDLVTKRAKAVDATRAGLIGLSGATYTVESDASPIGVARRFKKYFDNPDELPGRLQGTNIIKEGGGNWVNVGREIEPLLVHVRTPGLNLHTAEHTARDVAQNEWLKKKLDSYIRNQMGTIDDPIRKMADEFPTKQDEKIGELQIRLEDAIAARDKLLAEAPNRPPETLILSNAKINDIGKELNLELGRKALHYEPEALGGWESGRLALQRTDAGQLASGVAKEADARKWEDVSDYLIGAPRRRGGFPETYLEEYPWMAKLSPDDKIHELGYQDLYGTDDLGFQHLSDELRNLMDPESGLPVNMLINPSELGKMSMADVVNRVAGVNAWREFQRSEDNLAKASNRATRLYKEYADNNPLGLRWVELRARQATPESLGYQIVESPNGVRILDSKGQSIGIADSVEAAQRKLRHHTPSELRDELADALKYEGDSLIHCVGGYCPDVISGRSRIFSLRDARGRPHTTIEVKPGQSPEGLIRGEDLPPEVSADLMKRNVYDPSFMWRKDELGRYTPEIGPFGNRITQIKGKRNRKPDDEYLPFIHDFVQTGDWSDVKDLHHTGLRKLTDAFNSNELAKIQEAGIEVPKYATQKEINDIGRKIWPDTWGNAYDDIPEFSRGGVARRFKMYFDVEAEPKGSRSTNIVKEKGGNWLGGSVEDALRYLKRREYDAERALFRALPAEERLRRINLNRPTDNPIDMERINSWGDLYGHFGLEDAGPYALTLQERKSSPDLALNSWIDNTLTRYVKNEMATPEDPVRKLADRGVLHYNPYDLYSDRHLEHRSISGMLEPLAKTELGKQWEIISDSAISPDLAVNWRREASGATQAKIPGINKIPDTDMIHEILSGWAPARLGFPHLIDELGNAINPASDLPPNLRLSADKLGKVTVPQAVQRVHDINLYREEQARLADLAATKGLMLQKPFKEYKSGWRWAELPDPEASPENLNLVTKIGCQGGWCTQGEVAAHNYGGHAAGNRLYALIDPEGRVHTQIQTQFPKDEYPVSGEAFARLPQEIKDHYRAITAEWRKRNPDDPEVWKALAEAGVKPIPPSILQIKPFSNSWNSQMVKDFTLKNPKYKEEVIPYLQDFVRSGKWSDVSDLENAGLRNWFDAFSHSDLNELHRIGAKIPKYLTDDEIKVLLEGKSFPDIPEFSRGGVARRFKMYFDAEAEPKGSRSTNIIKEKGGNWVSGSVETGLKRYHQPVGAVEVNPTRQNVTAQSALSSWIDKTLARYVKNEMATSGDPVRELAERGVLHYTPDASHLDPQWSSYERAVRARRAGGFPEEGVAQSEQAKAWEMLSDLFIRRKAPWGGDVIPHHKLLDTFGTPAEKAAAKSYFGTITYDDASFNRFFNSNPGLKKRLEDRRAAKLLPAQKEYLAANKWATPDTVFYETPTFDHFDIGLRHLTDELRNAIDPASDLPPNLRLSADKLSKVTVPQAVQRVHDINLYRAEQARLANLAATQALMVQKPFKEYKSGWRWAELPDPEASPENLDLVKNIGCQGGWCTQGESAARNYGAHAAGKRLYALIDPEGRVHTQIQTVRNRSYGSDHLKAQRPQAEREAVEQGLDPDKSAYQSFVADRMYELAKENLPTSILQIKPFSNSWDSQMVKDFTLKNPKYKEEVIPYLQDFVRSGNWSDVQDLENAGLYPRSVLTLKEQALVPGKYVTMDEIKALREGKPWTPIDTTPEFAEGGLVRYNPAEIDVMVDELRTMVYG